MAELTIRSEVTGTVWKLRVSEGEPVGEDDVLLLVESMKMEIPVVCPEQGVVTRIFVREGDALAEGDPVVAIDLG